MNGSAEAAVVERDAVVFPPPGVRVVVFDVVGTLIEPTPPVAEAYSRAAAEHGVLVEPAEIQRRFRAAWRTQEAVDAAATPAFATSREREARRWRAIVDDVFAGVVEAEDIFAELWRHFGTVEAWGPIDRGRDLVRTAIDAGATVALASNFDERLLAIAGAIEPLSWVPHVFASSEIGWRKPAPEFFRVLEERLGCRPEETLLVGDDPDLDVRAALRAGWHALAVGGATA